MSDYNMMLNKYNDLISQSISDSIEVKTLLLAECSDQIATCAGVLVDAFRKGNKLLFCGNGGSAADCQHIVAELVVRFRSHVNRPALGAITLTVDPSIMTAGGNDIGFENVFAREVEALGRAGDVLVGISTSGNSPNVIRAVEQARLSGMKSICLLGCGGGKLANLCDANVIVPANVTARIQESHILIGHIWCEIIEEELFPEFCKIS